MNCSEFETGLADLLAAPGGGDDSRLRSLRAHAASCPECAGASDLVDLAARPAGERDPVDDPGEAYWGAFGARLSMRLAGEESRRRRFVALGAGLAAAALVAVGLLVGVIRREAAVGQAAPVAAAPAVPAPPETFRSETPVEPNPVDLEPAIDDDLAGGFAGAEPLDPFSEEGEGDLFPAVDQLAPADAERFLEWLTQEESRVRKGAA
jgi:hypothetical protein